MHACRSTLEDPTVEGVTGGLHANLGSLFTRYAPDLLDELYAGRPVWTA